MGDYSVPKEIRDLRPQGTMVKKITDGFYVYKYENFKDENGRWRTRSGECIGRITAGEGFIPNGKRLRSDEVSCRDFGGYRFVTENTAGVLEQLKKFFHPDEAVQIYIIAVIFFVNGYTYMKNIAKVFGLSYLSLLFPRARLGQDALRTLYGLLGTRDGKVKEYEQDTIDKSSGMVALDGHVISCSSAKSDLSAYGYKYKKIGMPQINWMTAYDVKKKKTLMLSALLCLLVQMMMKKKRKMYERISIL